MTDAWVALHLRKGPCVVGRVEAERDDGSWILARARILTAEGLSEFEHAELDLAPGRVEIVQRLHAGQPLVVDFDRRNRQDRQSLAAPDDVPRDPIEIFARFEPPVGLVR